MKIGINENFEIIQVNNITNEDLIIIELLEDSEEYEFPFYEEDGSVWSEEKLLKYCYEVAGKETKIYPKKGANIQGLAENYIEDLNETQETISETATETNIVEETEEEQND
jgi:hypothetical protein